MVVFCDDLTEWNFSDMWKNIQISGMTDGGSDLQLLDDNKFDD